MSLRGAIQLVYLVLAGCFLLAAGYQVRNVSGSSSVRRWLALAIVCAVVVAAFHFL